MIQVVAHYESKWMDDRTSQRMWSNLARAYGVELKMVPFQWESDLVGDVVVFDEEGEFELESWAHVDRAHYYFGRTGMNTLQVPHTHSVRIQTPNAVCQFGVVAAGIALEDRKRKLAA